MKILYVLKEVTEARSQKPGACTRSQKPEAWSLEPEERN
jgi:hypothetical protein